MMIEIEKRYLAKYIPVHLATLPCSYLEDMYISGRGSNQGALRLRRKDDGYEITKKIRIAGSMDDASMHTENTIALSKEEYLKLLQSGGDVLRKRRYDYTYDDMTYEIGVFDGELQGLVIVDVEFSSNDAFDSFVKPDFCGADVTQEPWVLGPALAGRSYADIAPYLEGFGYEAIG